MKANEFAPVVQNILIEAARRYVTFHPNRDLTEAWTGLGTEATYQPAVNVGLMTRIFPDRTVRPDHDQWWKLTNRGADVVGQMLRCKKFRKGLKNALDFGELRAIIVSKGKTNAKANKQADKTPAATVL